MALAHDDIWQKFDTVPDISDLLFDVGMDCDGLAGLDFSEPILVPPGGGQKVNRIASLPLIDCETDTLRHDCMWSGHCQEEEAVVAKQQLVVAPNWQLSTPSDLDSALDTSDLDETLSDCEEVERVGGDAMQCVSSNLAMSDHCYSQSQLLASISLADLTPAQSSEDEESASSAPDVSSFLRPSTCLVEQRKKERPTIRTRPPFQQQQQSHGPAKFKIQVKFTPGTVNKPRSLLRHPARLTKTFYSKRKGTTARTKAALPTLRNVTGAKAKRVSPMERVEDKGRDIRDLHNSMERQRRVDLKRSFDALKERIPSISAEDKVSKLMILNTASEYCRGLLKRETSLTTEREKEKRRNTLMKKKLTLLRTQHKTSLTKCTRRSLL